ncbi:6-phospho-3-hexuloisomerase [Hydrogenimonas sp.]|uniref:6-phospho-3-hexuloisomerase n=1 Tax=Hydrogenimonas sp. TaxID=2231112 RepID=UPI002605F574|nr:6-phospho-3-hexuloisomerase [Hydrogenimonas sp.]
MIAKHLVKQVKCGLQNANDEDFQTFVKYFLQNRRIFISGAGRSGLVGKFFAMRLMHLGNRVFVLGETNTPSIQKGDILVCISASGTTSSVLNAAKTAKGHGATIVGVTANPTGPLKETAEFAVIMDSRNKKKRKKLKRKDRKIPLGTSFELSSLMYLEAVVSEIMHICNIGEQTMKERHVNI